MALLGLGVYLHVEAGEERYDYDGLGRLIRRVDSRNQATDYVYDAAGNIVRVGAGADPVQPPVVSQVAPASIRRGETRQVSIVGSNLTGVGVAADSASLEVSDVRVAPTQIDFTLSVSVNAGLGAHAIRLTSAAGSTTASIAVGPVLPRLTVEPMPLAIPPDGVARPITLRLSNADVVDHVVALAASNTKVTVSPAQLSFRAGETIATAMVAGVATGTANIQATSATLGSSGTPVYVTADFRGIDTSHARILGVVLETPSSAATRVVSPVASRPLGVAVGNYVSAMAPSAFAVGSGNALLTITGAGLNTATAVAVVPSAGVTLGTPTVLGGGAALEVPVTVAADAPLTVRQVVVFDTAGKAFPVTQPYADRIAIVRSAPRIDSIDPLFAVRGTTPTLVVRGRNLQEARFGMVPSADMALDSDAVINADGTEARVRVAVGLGAALGDYLVVATTPGGSSIAAPSVTNTFRVVNEIRSAVTPILSAAVGVVLPDGTAAGRSLATYARPLGVSVGRVVTGVSPALGIVGTTATLGLRGVDLQGVTAVQLNPASGVAIGSVVSAPDGRSATVDLVIAADAARSARALKVMAGAAEVPFSDPAAAQFLVSAPLPAIASLAPNAVRKGQAPQSLLLTGRNFRDASAVVVLPPDNLTISQPTVNADGTQIAVAIGADANAAVGARTVTVVTPAGQSTTVASATNTLTVGQSVTPAYLMSNPLGIVLEGSAPAPATGFAVASNLGVVVETTAVPAPTQGVVAGRLGVALGPVTAAIEPTGFARGTTGVLTVRGTGLEQVDALTVMPADGITIGALVAAPDGRSVAAPITVAPGAQILSARRVGIAAGSASIPDARPAAMTFQVGPGVPQFDSIAPILARQGDKLTLTIRGQNLAGAGAVTATPPEGIVVSNTLTVDAAGAVLTVDLYVSPEAPLGPRVIRAWVPGAASDDVAAAVNTFTVYAP